MRQIIGIISFFLVLQLFLLACASGEKYDTNTAKGAFLLAEELDKDERYEEAVIQYTDVKNKHPYSQYAVESELKIADIHFKREAYIEAQNAYQLFKDFHPKHPKIAYVTYQLALSYYHQLPSTIDRDLSLAEKAILYFDETVNSYANSSYVTDARAKKKEILKMLAEKEMYIAEFYFIRDMYDSALGRYELLLNTYPGLGFDADALYGAASSSFKIGQPNKGRSFLEKLYGNFPESQAAARAKRELGRDGKSK